MSSPAAHVAELFTEFTDEEHADLIRADLEDLGRDELIRGFRLACGVLSGLVVAVEDIGPPVYTVLADARRRAQEALRRAEG